jgi:adenosylcobalamin-dependent ribonucleoside-triphosphate reductase
MTDILEKSTSAKRRAGGWHSKKNDNLLDDPSKTFIPGLHMFAAERAAKGEARERDDEFYYLCFRLRDDFIEPYKTRKVAWGFPIGGNATLGEINWLTKYSARKADGSKEYFWEGLRRVIEGMYSIQKAHALLYRLPWSDDAAHTSAQEAYERCFTGKWSPPGRGFWKMGTFFVNGLGDSSALQNCAFISTQFINQGDPSFPFFRLMEMSMLGIGVGFDTKGAGKVQLHQPIENSDEPIIVDDSREGWYESVSMLLNSYFLPDERALKFDYSEIRGRGEPIKGFGGNAAGPDPLIQLHVRLNNLLGYRQGEMLTSSDIVDIMNMVGKCVVAANVRSSAEIALGEPDDEAYIDLKNPMVNVERMGFVRGPDGLPQADEDGKWIESKDGGWGYTSNNSILADVGGRYDHIGSRIAINGEPGLVWLDVCRAYGRLADPPNNKDHRVMGVNPCAEQPLEHNELCTLVETYPTNCRSYEDYKRTLKFAYLYGKTVTLLPTHWPETNEVMMRNRRIGTSMSGLAQFVEQYGWSELRNWQDEGYAEIRRWDNIYSEWLGVRESIKVTTIKPSGTVSLLFGVTPGAHWPTERSQYLRRLRLTKTDPVANAMEEAGFPVEPNVQNPQFGVVVTCPTKGPDIPSEREVSVYLKVLLAVQCQEWWSDNAVSLTASFMAEAEGSQIAPLLQAFDGKMKSISFLPMADSLLPFPQMPYEKVSDEIWSSMWAGIGLLDWDRLYAGEAGDAEGEKYCTTDACEIP